MRTILIYTDSWWYGCMAVGRRDAMFLRVPEDVDKYMGVSKYRGGPPKSSILIGFSIINHPFWGTPIFGNTHI